LTAQSSVTSGDETYKTILGNGVYFGIVANTWNQAEAETNAAVKVLNATQQTGNDLTNDANQPWVIGQVKSGTLNIKGKDADVWCRAEDASKIKSSGNTVNYNYCDQSALDTYVDDIIANATSYSTSMAAKSSFSGSDTTYVTTSGNKVTIDITGLGDGTYYVNLDSIYANQQADGLTIKKKTGQTIVLNYTGTSVTLHKYTVVNGGTSYTTDQTTSNTIWNVASTVIWNMPNATSVNISGSVAGVLLAPQATATINGTSCGWLVANTVTSGSGEWHNVWQGMDKNYSKPGESGLTAYKSVDGATPTDSQTFDFYLDEKVNGTWSTIQTKQNSGSEIKFDDITYSATGTHYYRIYEKTGNSGYADNTVVYYVKTVVTSTTVANTTYYSASNSYYSDEARTNAISAAMTFSNISITSVPVSKVWDDSDNQDGTRPSSVTVRLLADGVDTGKTVTLSASNNWAATFSNLAKYSNGTAITYTVSEDAVAGYSTAITGSAADGYTITNSHSVTTTSITANKVWKNATSKVPVTAKLYKSTTNNYSTGSQPTATTHTVSFTTDGGPTYTVADGSSIIITMVTYGWPNYSGLPSAATYTMGTKSGNVTVAGPTGSGGGYREWVTWTATYEVDNITDDVSIALDASDLYWGFSFDYKNLSYQEIAGTGSSSGSTASTSQTTSVALPAGAELVDTQTLSEANNWSYVWKGLDKSYTYYVVEDVPDGYIVSYSYVLDANGKMTTTTITNRGDYQLPSTGGNGTGTLQLIGLLTVLGSVCGLYLHLRRTRRKGGDPLCRT